MGERPDTLMPALLAAEEREAALQAEITQERQLHAATRYREELLQRGGARLVERAALADELARTLTALHLKTDTCILPADMSLIAGLVSCEICALLARHAATKSANDD